MLLSEHARRTVLSTSVRFLGENGAQLFRVTALVLVVSIVAHSSTDAAIARAFRKRAKREEDEAAPARRKDAS